MYKYTYELQTTWGLLTEWWNSSTLGIWWDENVSPYFAETDWTNLFSVINSALEAVWGNLVEWWKTTAIYSWWENDVKPWFSKDTWLKAMNGVGKAFEEVWGSAIASVKEI